MALWLDGEVEGGGADQLAVGSFATVPSSRVKTTLPSASFVTVKGLGLRAAMLAWACRARSAAAGSVGRRVDTGGEGYPPRRRGLTTPTTGTISSTCPPSRRKQ